MNNIIKKMPIAISGLLLAMLSLGKLYNNNLVNNIILFIALIIILILILKTLFYHKIIISELKQLVVLSTSGTFSMALMLLATNILDYNYTIALLIWITGIVLHSLLIIVFTYKYILNDFDIENVYGSYWIVYVGITMAAISGSAFNLQYFTWIFFMFGFIAMIPTFLLVTYRYIYYPVKQEANKPLICIYTALFSILTVGYFSSFNEYNIYFIIVIFIIALCCYIFSIFKFIDYRKMPFYPSYSAYTFPFVISAIALTRINELFNSNILEYLVILETLVATILVIYVLYEYIRNIVL